MKIRKRIFQTWLLLKEVFKMIFYESPLIYKAPPLLLDQQLSKIELLMFKKTGTTLY